MGLTGKKLKCLQWCASSRGLGVESNFAFSNSGRWKLGLFAVLFQSQQYMVESVSFYITDYAGDTSVSVRTFESPF